LVGNHETNAWKFATASWAVIGFAVVLFFASKFVGPLAAIVGYKDIPDINPNGGPFSRWPQPTTEKFDGQPSVMESEGRKSAWIKFLEAL